MSLACLGRYNWRAQTEPLFCSFGATVETWLHHIAASLKGKPHPFVGLSAVSQQAETQDVVVDKEISPVCQPT